MLEGPIGVPGPHFEKRGLKIKIQNNINIVFMYFFKNHGDANSCMILYQKFSHFYVL